MTVLAELLILLTNVTVLKGFRERVVKFPHVLMTHVEVTGFAKSSKFQIQPSAIVVNVKMGIQAHTAKFHPVIKILVLTMENVLLKTESTYVNAIMVILVKIAKFHPAQLGPVKMVLSAQARYEKFTTEKFINNYNLMKENEKSNMNKLSHSVNFD